ncbi:MAG: hypothetical protein R2851_22480 [Caldilineaceae bacterium]
MSWYSSQTSALSMVGAVRRQEIHVAAQLKIEIVAQNVPEVAVHAACVLGGDVADVRVDVTDWMPGAATALLRSRQRCSQADQPGVAGNARRVQEEAVAALLPGGARGQRRGAGPWGVTQ